jgi:hypothetical protein
MDELCQRFDFANRILSRVALAKGATVVAGRRVASLLSTLRASEHGDLLRRCIDHMRMLIFQTESGFSKKRCSDVQEWGHVCSLEAQKLWRFRGIYQFYGIVQKMQTGRKQA